MTRKQAYETILKKLTETEQEYVKMWYDGYIMFHELRDPIAESKEVKIGKDIYFCRRESYFDTWDGKIMYGYTIYKWDGTYTEKTLIPGGDKTFKFKNWHEIFHGHGTGKENPTKYIQYALATIGEINNEETN